MGRSLVVWQQTPFARAGNIRRALSQEVDINTKQSAQLMVEKLLLQTIPFIEDDRRAHHIPINYRPASQNQKLREYLSFLDQPYEDDHLTPVH